MMAEKAAVKVEAKIEGYKEREWSALYGWAAQYHKVVQIDDIRHLGYLMKAEKALVEKSGGIEGLRVLASMQPNGALVDVIAPLGKGEEADRNTIEIIREIAIQMNQDYPCFLRR
jgi:hypothetical protein